jgi:hypothetical protein
MFLGPRASLNTRHVHCFSKKPWCWINAKVKLSVLRCGQVELSLSFRVRFECSKVDKCVLTSSLLIIKQGKDRKLKDEIDDFVFDDVVQQSLFLFLFMSLMFVLVHASIVWISWLQTCTYHSTAFWRQSTHSLTHSLTHSFWVHSLGEAWVGIGKKCTCQTSKNSCL